MKWQEAIRQMFDDMMRVERLDGLCSERQFCADVSPDIDSRGKEISIDVRPTTQIIALPGSKMDLSRSNP
jgi:hypothetical protein